MTEALLIGCHPVAHKSLVKEQISRPPPFWPPHEHVGPGIKGTIPPFDNYILLQKYLKDRSIDSTKLTDAEHP